MCKEEVILKYKVNLGKKHMTMDFIWPSGVFSHEKCFLSSSTAVPWMSHHKVAVNNCLGLRE